MVMEGKKDGGKGKGERVESVIVKKCVMLSSYPLENLGGKGKE